MAKTTLFILALLALSVLAYDPHLGCAHNIVQEESALLDVQEEFLPEKARLLATVSYPNIRMTADHTNLIEGTTEVKTYIQKELLPAVMDYYQASIAVKQPLTTALKVSTTTKTICGYTTPSVLFTGVNTDFFVITSSTTDEASNWVASAGACLLSTATKRPLVAQMLFNLYYTKPANGDALIHEKNMYLVLHEMLHALGFTGTSFKNFIDATGKTLTGHLKTVTLNGSSRQVLDVEPLTSKLRAHYGCSTLPGAFLENDGGSGTAGSHFERRHFLYEAMTSGVIQGLRLSEFSFAVLEGSGWYMPDYSYADQFTVGQGQGCGFLYDECNSATFLKYDEFCSVSGSRSCGHVGVAGGVCSTDSRSDGCQYSIPVLNYHCEDSDAIDNARLPTKEVYGRTTGSKCFNGNLTTLTKTSDTSFCFKYKCVGTGASTTLQVYLGSGYITCKSESALKISGYNGVLKCPDPLSFCSTTGKQTCPRKCMGRGSCVNNQCVCNTGYTGIDCAMNA